MLIYRLLLGSASVVFALLSVLWAHEQGSRDTRVLRIGLSDAIRHIQHHTTNAAALAEVQPLAEIFVAIAGIRPELQIDSPENLVQKLREGRIQLAVMPGIEYGWLGDKVQGLVPLVLVVNHDIRLRACLLTRAEGRLGSIARLKGLKLALPRRSELHVHLFLHHLITRSGGVPDNYFGATPSTSNADTAIELVLNKEADGVALDSQSWEAYQERKPERTKKLKVVATSADFPVAIILINPGILPDEEIKRLREGLLSAHEKPFCRQILNCCRISRFIPHNEEYHQVVLNILKAFPKSLKLARLAPVN